MVLPRSARFEFRVLLFNGVVATSRGASVRSASRGSPDRRLFDEVGFVPIFRTGDARSVRHARPQRTRLCKFL